MNSFTLLQVSESVLVKSAEMAEKDPHGTIITLVSVGVVFVALVILYFAYTFIGKLTSGQIDWKALFKFFSKKPAWLAPNANVIGPSTELNTSDSEVAAAIALALDQEMNGEVYAAISMAMHQYLNDTVHDMESYIITIRRK